MGRTLRGSYSVRGAETQARIEHGKPPSGHVAVDVRLLDKETLRLTMAKKTTGNELLALVTAKLDITLEVEYFGLRLPGSVPVCWLDPTVAVKKQVTKTVPIEVEFGVRFFVTQPNELVEEYTRFLYFLQIKNDVAAGRLVCRHDTAIDLAAYAVQAELGDYDPGRHMPGYLSDVILLPQQTIDQENEICRLHQKLQGTSAPEAEREYLALASHEETYGCDMFRGCDGAGQQMGIAVASNGIRLYRLQHRLAIYKWQDINHVSFSGKAFSVVTKQHGFDATPTSTFRCFTKSECRQLWKSVVVHHTFFRRRRPLCAAHTSPIRRALGLQADDPLVRSGFSGRTHAEVVIHAQKAIPSHKNFERVSSLQRSEKRQNGHAELFFESVDDPRRRSVGGLSPASRQDSHASFGSQQYLVHDLSLVSKPDSKRHADNSEVLELIPLGQHAGEQATSQAHGPAIATTSFSSSAMAAGTASNKVVADHTTAPNLQSGSQAPEASPSRELLLQTATLMRAAEMVPPTLTAQRTMHEQTTVLFDASEGKPSTRKTKTEVLLAQEIHSSLSGALAQPPAQDEPTTHEHKSLHASVPLASAIYSGPIFLRALFSFVERAVQLTEVPDDVLTFARGEVLRVVDMVSPEWWVAESMRNHEIGRIPSLLLPSPPQKSNTEGSAAVVVQLGNERKNPSMHKRGTMTLLSQSMAHDAQRQHQTQSTMAAGLAAVGNFGRPLYEVVEQRNPSDDAVRPIVILGPCKDNVIDCLVSDHPELFHTCVPHTSRPRRGDEVEGLDYFFVSHEQMVADAADGKFIETMEYQGNLYGTSYAAVLATYKLGGLCLVDVSNPSAIQTLSASGMEPISVLVKPQNINVIMQEDTTCGMEAAQGLMRVTAKVEEQYSALFSQIFVQSSGEIYTLCESLLAFVLTEQTRPFWAPVDQIIPQQDKGMSLSTSAALLAPQRDENQKNTSAERVSQLTREKTKSIVAKEVISFERLEGGFGFSFSGGLDSNYFKADDSLYVTKILEGGAAALDGRLQVGDKILEANGVPLLSVTHEMAVSVLRSNDTGVTLKVARKCQCIKLEAKDGHYGLGLAGGADLNLPVTISKIQENSPAERHPKLKVGYEITHINGESLHTMTQAEVLVLVRSYKDELELIIHPRKLRPNRSSETRLSTAVSSPPSAMSQVSPPMPPARSSASPAVVLGSVLATNAPPLSQSPPFPGPQSETMGTTLGYDTQESNPFFGTHKHAADNETDKMPRGSQAFLVGSMNMRKQSGEKIGLPAPAPVVLPQQVQQPARGSLGLQATDPSSLPKAPHQAQVASTPSLIKNQKEMLVSRDKGRQVVAGDFKAIPVYKQGYTRECDCSLAITPKNTGKNRYKDILPYDDSRVRLQQGDDYINANHVFYDVGKLKLNYLAAQGPTPKTTPHFWQMVWEQDVRIITMLTTLMENGRPKCHQYWPDLGKEVTHGAFLVTTEEETVGDDGIVQRQLRVRNMLANAECIVTHMHFTSWPDHGVPDTYTTFLNYLERVQLLKDKQRPRPLLVHCSAGIGRTGVFILLEIALACLQTGQDVNMPSILTRLRQQRMGLIQTEPQFRFCYNTLHSVSQEQGSHFTILPS